MGTTPRVADGTHRGCVVWWGNSPRRAVHGHPTPVRVPAHGAQHSTGPGTGNALGVVASPDCLRLAGLQGAEHGVVTTGGGHRCVGTCPWHHDNQQDRGTRFAASPACRDSFLFGALALTSKGLTTRIARQAGKARIRCRCKYAALITTRRAPKLLPSHAIKPRGALHLAGH